MPSSDIMPIIPNGKYKIFNGQFPTQDADLLFGQQTAPVVGYANNTGSFNMVWDLSSDGDVWNRFSFTNMAPSANGAYASVNQTTTGAELHGSSNATFWTLQPAGQKQYQILAAESLDASTKLVWSLASGDDGTPITLAPIVFNDPYQLWTLVPQIQTGGNVARGINDLD